MIKCRTARSRVLAVSLLSFALCWMAHTIWANVGGPSANDGKVARIVAQYLEEGHVSKYKLDDEISRRAFWALISGSRTTLGFDPAKVYFEKRDIEEFKKHETTLDDEIMRGDISFAYQVLERYIQRLRERIALVEEFVHAEHDFTVNEFLSTDYENMDFGSTPDEIRELWRKKIKFELLQQRLEKKPLPDAEQREKVVKRYRNLLHRWADQTTSDEVLEMYLNAVTTSFDPHSNYMSPTTEEDFNISMRLHLDGIGARLSSEDGFTIVKEVLPGGAADQDGRLQVEDKIIGVGADGATIVDVVDMKLTDVVKKIRGPRDTSVLLRVLPAGKMEAVEYKLMRAKIELKGQEAKGEIIEAGKKADGAPFRVGYINLPSFYFDISAANNNEENVKSCKQDVQKILIDFQKTQGGVDGVILDLRTNGGGALQEAIDLTGLFIDKGTVVKVKGRSDREDLHKDKEAGTVYAGPLMVLVNKLSASASEILAGAIQDYSRGLIVGDSSTHGKGTVQTVVPLGGNRAAHLGALKLTIQQFYRVNGDSTQNRGVISDIVLPSLSDHIDGEANLPQALPFDHVKPSEHDNLGLITPDLKAQLLALSEKRRAESSDFRKLEEDIVRWEEMKQRKSIALSEERRREEMKRADKAEEALNDPDAPPDPDKPKKKDAPVFERAYMNNEILAIMEDFLRLGHHPRVVTKI